MNFQLSLHHCHYSVAGLYKVVTGELSDIMAIKLRKGSLQHDYVFSKFCRVSWRICQRPQHEILQYSFKTPSVMIAVVAEANMHEH